MKKRICKFMYWHGEVLFYIGIFFAGVFMLYQFLYPGDKFLLYLIKELSCAVLIFILAYLADDYVRSRKRIERRRKVRQSAPEVKTF